MILLTFLIDWSIERIRLTSVNYVQEYDYLQREKPEMLQRAIKQKNVPQYFSSLTLFIIRLFRTRPADIDAAKVMQTESRTCQARLGNYAEVQLTLSKITSNPPNKPPPFPHFLQKYLHNPNKCLTFALSVLAKPLNNAQIVRGVFYLWHI